MITATKDVERYAKQVMEVRGLLENLTEFFDSLPAPDEDENVNLDYGHLGSLDRIHTLLTEASEITDEMYD